MTTLSTVPGVFMFNGVPMITPDKLKEIPGYNVRDTFDPIGDQEDKELVQSIAINGFQADKPVTVRFVGNDVYVIAGHRRLAATLAAIANGAKIKGIAIIPEAKGAGGKTRDMAEMAADLVLSNSGKRLQPVENGAAILRMRECGWDDSRIAETCGFRDAKWVRELAKLARTEPRIKALIKAGVVAPTLALETVAKHGQKAAEIIEAAAKKGTGANAGKATGKTVAAVTGVAAKNAKVAPVVAPPAGKPIDRLQQNATQHAALAAKAGAAKPATSGTILPTAILAGPFALGTGIDDCTVLDRNGLELCELADLDKARAMLLLLNQGWTTYAGKSDRPAPEPVKPVTASVGTVVAGASTAKAGKGAQASATPRVARKSGK